VSVGSRSLLIPTSHTNHLDAPRLIENQTQQAVWRWDHQEPFGVTVAVLCWLILEDRRIRSVELNEQGVSALVWARKPLPFFCTLERVFINWREVRQVGMRGLSIWIDSGRYNVPINTNLSLIPNRSWIS